MIVLAGPCQIESIDHTLNIAGRLAEIADQIGIEIIFKASFDKANRTSADSPRGAGLCVAEEAFARVRRKYGLPIITDVHEPWQCPLMAEVADVLQIPALLCRQTDLIAAAAETGRTVNIKKGQFLRPGDMEHAVGKARMAGAKTVWATERGTSFGYGDLIVDMRSIPIMQRSGADSTIFDCTHSVQTPGSLSGATGGDRSMTDVLARAAIAAGADGLFLECHNDPASAPSDGAVMMDMSQVKPFLIRMTSLFTFMKTQ